MRILLADHHYQTLQALKTMLRVKTGYEVIGEAVHASDLMILIAANPPDVVVIDQELPGLSIVELICELHNCEPRPAVVVISGSPEYRKMLLQAGADAFVSKSDEPEWLLEILEKFANPPNSQKEK
jgi:DNA-binding NarL/FixJ family response regulator